MLLVALQLQNQRALVVGGGRVATRKIRRLLGAGARIRVVSPDLTRELQELATSGQLEWVPRPWQPGDGLGAAVVIAATGSPAVDRAVAGEARQAGQPVAVASAGGWGTLAFMAEVRRGPVRVGVSTSGLAPALAQRLCRHLEEQVGPEWAQLAELYGAVRSRLRSLPALSQARRAELLEALAAGPALALLAQGRSEAAQELAERLVEQARTEGETV